MVDTEALQNLEKLNQLRQEGIISDAEFDRSKERLLFGGKQRKVVQADPLSLPDHDDVIGWITLPLKRYAQFTGRSSRQEFWMFQIAYVVLFTFTLVAVALDGEGGALAGLAFIWLIVGLLGLAVPLIAVEVRRFHDQDRSGWFALLNLIPYVGPLIVLAMMCIDGTPGDNRFGSNPKGV